MVMGIGSKKMSKNKINKKSYIGWKKELHMRETPTIIEDTISREKQWKKKCEEELKKLNFLSAPVELIEHAKMKLSMTYAEWVEYNKIAEEQQKKQEQEYFENNPIQKDLVDLIYEKESKLEYDYYVYLSRSMFDMQIDPISFIGKTNYLLDRYEAILIHAHRVYHKRYEKEWEMDNKRLEEENIAFRREMTKCQ